MELVLVEQAQEQVQLALSERVLGAQDEAQELKMVPERLGWVLRVVAAVLIRVGKELVQGVHGVSQSAVQ